MTDGIQIIMSKKITSHELARMLLAKPDMVVMVNGDFNACETEELTEVNFECGTLENGDDAGGVIDATSWIKIGR